MPESNLSNEEIEELVKEVKEQLRQLNLSANRLLSEGVYGHWYVGPNYSQVYLPDSVRFQRNRVEKFGED